MLKVKEQGRVMERLAGKMIRPFYLFILLSILVTLATYLYDHQLGRVVAIAVARLWFFLGAFCFCVFAGWYAFACVVGLVQWRIDLYKEARLRQAGNGKVRSATEEGKGK